MPTIVIRFDLRSPDWAATPHPELYATCLDMCAWAEEQSFDSVVISEHHGKECGYLPSPVTLAAAIAGRTKRIPITIAAALFPLHDPIRLAEQLAVADLVSGGRVMTVVGLGYAEEEFHMAGVERKGRGKRTEEYIEVMQKAWTGEPFEWQGRTIRVTPKPLTQPHPVLLMGGSTEVAARRAARLHLGFFPADGDPRLEQIYLEEAAKVDHPFPFCQLPKRLGFVHVTEDPEKDWETISRYAWYDADTYKSWQTPGQSSAVTSEATDVEELRREGIYRVLTPDECVALAEELGDGGTILFHPLLCGLPTDLAWSSLELFRDKVLPRIRAGAPAG